jgi:hypothetical protein
VQRPTLSDRRDGDMLRQPGVLQIKEPGVLNTQTLVVAADWRIVISPRADHPSVPPTMEGRVPIKTTRQVLTCMF